MCPIGHFLPLVYFIFFTILQGQDLTKLVDCPLFVKFLNQKCAGWECQHSAVREGAERRGISSRSASSRT